MVIRPFSMPKLSLRILATGARQLVVQEPLEMMWCFFGSYFWSFTPSTTVKSASLPGAEMMTFLAPAVRCLAAPSRAVKKPVHSMTRSTFMAFHGSFSGSRSVRIL